MDVNNGKKTKSMLKNKKQNNPKLMNLSNGT